MDDNEDPLNNVDNEESSFFQRAEKTMLQATKKSGSFDASKGYLLRQFWYFCGDTSLHGWKYIPQFAGSGGLGWTHRIIWFLLVLCGMTFGWINVWLLFREYYWQTPTISISDTTGPISEVYFPSVTVCNLNQFRMSQVNRMSDNGKIKTETARQFMDTYILADTNKTWANSAAWDSDFAKIKENLAKAGINWDDTKEPFITVNGTTQDCKDLMLLTKWNDVDQYNYDSHVTYTDFGMCCRIFPKLELEEPNMLERADSTQWVKEEFRNNFTLEYQRRIGSKNGIENGLMLLMDVESFENAHYPRKDDGLIVALSDNLERPIVGQSGTFVEPGSANLISFQVFGINTTDDAREKYPPNKKGGVHSTRNCYVDDNERLEFNPKYYDRAHYFKFSISNCLYSAMVDAIKRECNCTASYAKKGERIVESRSNLGSSVGAQCCVGENLKCMERLTRLWGSSEYNLNKAKHVTGSSETEQLCHDNCDSQEFRVVTSRSGYPKKRTLRLTEDFCLIVFKLRNICADNYRKKAFEDYYKGETLPGAVAITCSIVTAGPVTNHCQQQSGQDTLYTPTPEPTTSAIRNAEANLEKLVLRYAEDNILVTRVFMKDPYYMKMTRDRQMSRLAFFGSAGGWLGLCCGLSIISVCEIVYHGILFLIAICKGRELSWLNYD